MRRLARIFWPQQSVTPPTRVVAGARRLDLDHTRSEVAEHHRCMLAGQRPGKIDDRNAIPTTSRQQLPMAKALTPDDEPS